MASVADYQTALRAVTYVNTSDNPNTTSRTVTFIATDGTTPSAGANKPLTVTATNDTPTLNAIANTTATVGVPKTVNLAGITAGGGETQGLTVTATSNDTSVVPNPTVTYTSPSAVGSLTFTPVAAGTATITVRVTDNNGTPGDMSDDALVERTFTVTASANLAPVHTAPASVSTNEDTLFAFTGVNAISVSDPDNTSGNLTTVVSVPDGRGTLSATTGAGAANVTGSTTNSITITGNAANVSAALATLIYTPPADANVNTLGGTVPLTVSTTDALGGNDEDTVAVTVSAVNDAPSFALAGDPPAVNEDASPQLIDNFATSIAGGPATATDETGQTLTFLVTNNTSAGLFSAGPAISGTGTLTYTPAPGASGTATITVVLQDDGGGTNTSAPQQFTITVNAISDAPAGSDATVTTNEDMALVFTVANFGFADPADSPADAFAGIVVTGLPAPGALTTNGAPVTAGQFISAADIASGNLRFTPAPNSNGPTALRFQVQDTGSAGANLDPTPNTLTVNVTAINDAPAVSLAAPAVGISPNVGPYTQDNFATFAPGGADETGQTPTYLVTADNTGLFSVQPAIDASGTLTFTPASGVSGSATVTVVVRDSGPGVAPNVNTSAPVQFTVTVFEGSVPSKSAGLSVASSAQLVAIGSDAGVPGHVQVINATTGAVVRDFFPFGVFAGGLHVAVADLTGDGADDIIVATASQLGLVAVFDGVTGAMVRVFLPFGPFPAGVQVATGDLDGDGRQDLVIGLVSGAPLVVAINGRTGEMMRLINAIPGFAGGVQLAVGDVTGDGRADIVTVAGPGGNGLVVVYDGATGGLAGAFFSFLGLPSEVNLAVGDLTGDGLAELVAGVPVPGGTLLGAFTPAGQLVQSYFVPTFVSNLTNQSARLATADVNGDGIADLLVSDAPGLAGGKTFVLNGATGAILSQKLTFERITRDPLLGIFVETN
jgi:hypothetical protein